MTPKQLYKRAGDFILGLNPLLVGVLMFAAGIAGLTGMVTYNQANDFCFKCHQVRGPYYHIDLESTVHEPYVKNLHTQAHVNCVECHSDKEVVNYFGDVARLAGEGFDKITSLPRDDAPGAVTQYDDRTCLRCHYRILETDEIEDERLFELTPKLAQIGLRFSHRRHWWMRAWTPELQARLEGINNGGIRVEQEELEVLQRARLAHCAQCHDRYYRDPGMVDKTVNLYTSNPMSCASCHLDATPDNHPGNVLSLPTEKSCRRCHNGILHGRMKMFLADQESPDKKPCIKCHPAYVIEEQINIAEDSP